MRFQKSNFKKLPYIPKGIWVYISIFIFYSCNYAIPVESNKSKIGVNHKSENSTSNIIVIADSVINSIDFKVYFKNNSKKIYLDKNNNCVDSMFSFAEINASPISGIILFKGNKFIRTNLLIIDSLLFLAHVGIPNSTNVLYIIDLKKQRFLNSDEFSIFTSSYSGFLFNNNCFFCSDPPLLIDGELPSSINYYKLCIENNKLKHSLIVNSFWDRSCLWDSLISFKLFSKLCQK